MVSTAHRKKITNQKVRAMEFFTLLYIEYSLRGIDIETYLILPDYEACQIAIRDNENMPLYFNADSDVNMFCVRTDTLSRSIKPMLRPTTDISS
jgi:hypothetical protein